jgi:hypothetical protein
MSMDYRDHEILTSQLDAADVLSKSEWTHLRAWLLVNVTTNEDLRDEFADRIFDYLNGMNAEDAEYLKDKGWQRVYNEALSSGAFNG